jgi:predicted nucleic acid-binding protein
VIDVADTTPLLYLSRIGRLDIARTLYGQVLVAARPLASKLTI